MMLQGAAQVTLRSTLMDVCPFGPRQQVCRRDQRHTTYDHLPVCGDSHQKRRSYNGKNAPINTDRGLITKTTTIMRKLFSRRKQPERGRAVQPPVGVQAVELPESGRAVQLPVSGQAVKLPESGFEHPFRVSSSRRARPQGMEHPRTVSVGSSRNCCKFRHRAIRSSSCGCARSLITSEKGLAGGRR